MSVRQSLLATALLLGTAGSAAADGAVRALYGVSFAGFQIARGSLSINVEGSDYAARVQISTSGIARIVADEESNASAAGRISGASVMPSTYNLFSQGERTTQVAMQLNGGSVASLSASPPLSEAEDRVEITSAHQRRITDPLSAVVLPLDGNAIEGACDRTLPVFDGWTRYDVTLSYKAMETVSVDGYAGPAVVCAARWVPVAGHRSERESTRFMAENREIEGWFIPVEGADVMIPYRISLATMRGRLVVTATRIELGAPESN